MDTSDYKSQMKKVEKTIGHEFRYKRFLIIALTHKSKKVDHKIQENFYNSYENLEYLGDAVHKFFVVKRIKELVENNPSKFEHESKFNNNDNLIDAEGLISTLNNMKTVAETNSLLGFICIREEIFKGILVGLFN